MQDNLLIVIALVILGVLAFLFLQPCLLVTCLQPPIVENADHKQEIKVTEMTSSQRTTARPLVEYPNTALVHVLSSVPNEVSDMIDKTLPRPLVTFPNSAHGIRLSDPQTSPTTLARPLIEHPNGAENFTLQEASASHIAQPRPLIEHSNSSMTLSLKRLAAALAVKSHVLTEYVNSGWSTRLKRPVRLLGN